jgi:Rod binding domain-containing protein
MFLSTSNNSTSGLNSGLDVGVPVFDKKDPKQVKKVAQDLEKVFFATMLKKVLVNKEEPSLSGENSNAYNMIKEMWVEAIANSSGGKSLGIASSIEKSILSSAKIEEKNEQLQKLY